MANPFYSAGRERSQRVGDLFAAIAPRYDLVNDLQSFGWHRRWKRQMVRLAELTPGARALDLCCGTGDVAFALARQGADVVGLDFSEPMLAVALERGMRQQHGSMPGKPRRAESRPRFIRGDAERIPFPAAHFDVVTISYGLRNLADWNRGLREMCRVTRPGGRVLVLDFGKPDNPIWRWLYFCYLRWCVPVLGRLFCGNAPAYAYILESLRHYPAQHGVAASMRDLGLQEVRVLPLLGGMMSINFGRRGPTTALPSPVA